MKIFSIRLHYIKFSSQRYFGVISKGATAQTLYLCAMQYSREILEESKKSGIHPSALYHAKLQTDTENKKLKYLPKKIWRYIKKEENLWRIITASLVICGWVVTKKC